MNGVGNQREESTEAVFEKKKKNGPREDVTRKEHSGNGESRKIGNRLKRVDSRMS